MNTNGTNTNGTNTDGTNAYGIDLGLQFTYTSMDCYIIKTKYIYLNRDNRYEQKAQRQEWIAILS